MDINSISSVAVRPRNIEYAPMNKIYLTDSQLRKFMSMILEGKDILLNVIGNKIYLEEDIDDPIEEGKE